MDEIVYHLDKLIGSYVATFGIYNQFLEVSLTSDEYAEIRFFFQCSVSTPDEDIVSRQILFDDIDADLVELIVLFKAYQQKVISHNLTEETLALVFENNYQIIIHLHEDQYGEPLSITFKKSLTSKEYISLNFFGNNGEITISNTVE